MSDDKLLRHLVRTEVVNTLEAAEDDRFFSEAGCRHAVNHVIRLGGKPQATMLALEQFVQRMHSKMFSDDFRQAMELAAYASMNVGKTKKDGEHFDVFTRVSASDAVLSESFTGEKKAVFADLTHSPLLSGVCAMCDANLVTLASTAVLSGKRDVTFRLSLSDDQDSSAASLPKGFPAGLAKNGDTLHLYTFERAQSEVMEMLKDSLWTSRCCSQVDGDAVRVETFSFWGKAGEVTVMLATVNGRTLRSYCQLPPDRKGRVTVVAGHSKENYFVCELCALHRDRQDQ